MFPQFLHLLFHCQLSPPPSSACSPSSPHCLIPALGTSVLGGVVTARVVSLFLPLVPFHTDARMIFYFKKAKLVQLDSIGGSIVPSGLSLDPLSGLQGPYPTRCGTGLLILNCWLCTE